MYQAITTSKTTWITDIAVNPNTPLCDLLSTTFAARKRAIEPLKKNLKIKIKIPLSKKYIRVPFPRILSDLVEN